ncbi:MAG: recombinase RecA [Ghiorsea sp.]
MASLSERILKNSLLKRAEIFATSTHMDGSFTSTPIPMLNVALSGKLGSGLSSGLTVIAGPSKHFKSLIGLVCVASFLKENKDGVCLFYDSEFGASSEYFDSVGIDSNRVVHIPIMDIEEAKFDIVAQLEDFTKKDKVIIFIDSIGNLASKKEVEDAKDGKSVGDMTRAKQLKSLFRMTTPYLTLKDIPMIAINHTYNSQEMYSKTIVSGGTGIYYSAQTILVIGRQQEKDGKEIIGYNFILNIEKSRFVREKAKIPLHVTFEDGINKWSGLLEAAQATGHVLKPSNGYYTRAHIPDDKKHRAKETNNAEFWTPVLTNTDFGASIEKLYYLSSHGEMIKSE